MQEWLEVIIRTFAAIIILFFLTKLLGKRQISELSLFEYITGISIGNIAAYISLDIDNLWYLGIISLCVWVSVSVGIEFWTLKSRKANEYIDGKSTVLIKNGKLEKSKLAKERLTVEELLEQLRQKDVFRVADVEFAVMEPNGELDVMLKKQFQPITPDMLGWYPGEDKPSYAVIIDGKLIKEELQQSGQNEDFVHAELKQLSLKLDEVLLAQIDGNNEMTFHTMDGRSLPQKKPSGYNASSKEEIRQSIGRLMMELRMLEGKLDEKDRSN
ncbi:DUF421 domain-containing protein [Paenibacillus sp. CAU 1782]